MLIIFSSLQVNSKRKLEIYHKYVDTYVPVAIFVLVFFSTKERYVKLIT